MKIIVFHCHLFVYRLCHVRSSIHLSLDIFYSFCPDASENRLIHTYSTMFYSFFKSGMISTTYHKYSKSFIENIPSSSVLCFENLLKEFFNLDSEVFVDYSLLFFFCNEKLCICFWKRLFVCKKVGLFSKKIKVSKDSNSAEFIVFLCNFSDTFSLEILKESVKKIVFFPNWYILEKKTKIKQNNPHKGF